MEILVATSGDFALLRDGRPVASGVWDDVVRAHADTRAGTVCLTLRLRDGAAFVARDDMPGWDDLLDAAESALDLPRRQLWWADALAADAAHPLALFARGGDAR